MSKILDGIAEDLLKEMFNRVGAKYTKKFIEQPEWYNKYTWTTEEEQDFKKHGIHILKRKVNMTPKFADLQMAWFIFNYGWKIKDA